MRPALPVSRSYRLFLILFLLGAAAYWFCLFGPKSLDKIQLGGIIVAGVAVLIPGVSQAVDGFALACDRKLNRHPARTSLAVGALICAYLLAFTFFSHDRLFLKLNDEHAYMIQARMLARGRLWMPAYPPAVSPFFDALAMIVDRVYAPMYFPGTALAMVPFVWLGLSYWWMTVLTAATAAGFLYAVLTDLFDPFRAVLGVIILASLHTYRGSAILLLAESPFLAAETVLFWAWLRFHGRPMTRWAIVIGAAAGYAAITRPLDALCFVLPVGAALIWQLRRLPGVLIRYGVVMVLAAAPFLLILVVQNIGVTGHWWELAEGYFNRQNFPATPMGFHHIAPGQMPVNLNAVKQQWLRDWILPSFARHTPANAIRTWYRGRLVQLLDNALPNPILILLLPLALFSMRELRRVAVFASLVLFCIGYAIYLFFLEHYVVSILPAMICLILMGGETLQSAWSGARTRSFVTLSLLAISVSVLWPVVPVPPLPDPFAPDQRPASRLLAHLPITPAVVLFRFDPDQRIDSFNDDPVYTDTVPFPDDAAVVRARDLGPEKNRDLIHYYARHQPDRVFYIYDPDARYAGQNPLSPPLGTAADLDVTGTVP